MKNEKAERPPYSANDNVVYYLLHQAVITGSSSTITKVGAVFNASSHDSGMKSLNDWLDSRPNLYSDIVALL